MKHNTTIAGISIDLILCKKINQEKTSLAYTALEPLTTISESELEDTYVVDIMAFIPIELKKLNTDDLISGLVLNKEETLFLSYTGVSSVETSIDKPVDSGLILCRGFNVEFECDNQLDEFFNLYHIRFNYKLLDADFQSVEGIIVKLINEDPRTDRGTVTVPKL